MGLILGVATAIGLLWMAVGVVAALWFLLEVAARVSVLQRQVDQFGEVFGDPREAQRHADRLVAEFENPEPHRWGYIRRGSTLLDVVSPECVDDIEDLERSLYLEGLDIIEHGGG